MGRLSKEEMRVMMYEDALKEAKERHDKAVDEIIAGKDRGIYGNKYDKEEKEARTEVMRIESLLRDAKDKLAASKITDEEVEAIAASFKAGKEEEFEDDAFIDELASTF